MKLLVLADKEVGYEVVSYMIEQFPQDISLLLTITDNEIYKLAKRAGIRVKVFEATDVSSALENKEFDLGILAWWPYIIKKSLIDTPAQGFINFHPSYLPFNRGKHYNFWAIVEESPFGVTLHRVTEGIDSGDIISQQLIEYDWTDTGESLYKKAHIEIVNLFKVTYPKVREVSLDSICSPQDLSSGSFHYAAEIEPASELHLDQEYSAKHLFNLLRARTFEGHPSCWFTAEDGNQYEVKIQVKRKFK